MIEENNALVPSAIGLAGQQAQVVVELRHAERGQQPHGGRRLAESAERVELGQRADQFRLVRAVPVVALRRGQRNPGDSSSANPRAACSADGWACRDSGSAAASTFSRNGSRESNSSCARAAERGQRVRSDDVGQRPLAVVGDQQRGIGRVRADPELGLRMR